MLQLFFFFSPLEDPSGKEGWCRGGRRPKCVTGSDENHPIGGGTDTLLCQHEPHHGTWFQWHHVVVALGDTPDSGGPSQAAQARLARPAAVRLHQAIQGSVESAHPQK